MEAPTLHGEQILVRAVAEVDVESLLAILRTPEVHRWWQTWDLEDAYAKVRGGGDGLAYWVVELQGDVIGFVQAYEETDPDFRHAGIDLFVDPRHHGHGVGRDVVRTVARYLFETLDHHRLVIDPAAANTRAIRCYEAVGFRRVGIARASWWDHVEERWADGVLLDLLRGELV